MDFDCHIVAERLPIVVDHLVLFVVHEFAYDGSVALRDIRECTQFELV